MSADMRCTGPIRSNGGAMAVMAASIQRKGKEENGRYNRSGGAIDVIAYMIASLTLADLLGLLGMLSLVTFIGSLVVIPWLVLSMDTEYFIRHRQEVIERHKRHPVITIIVLLLRNSSGLLLLAAGVIMLILPGQGILTMVIGFSLMDFPGKHTLTDKIIQNRKLQQSLNWIRRKGHKKDLVF